MPKDKFSPRKLPQQLRSKATVDAIFEAAMQVLANTPADPSVQHIADRAGVSVGSLYQYFPTKEALVGALIRLHLKQRVDDLEARFATVQGASAEAAARTLVEGLVAMMKPRLGIERAMMRSFVRAGDLLSLTALDQEMTAAVERFLQSVKHQLRPVDLSLAAFVVMNALRSTLLLTVLEQPERLDDPAFTDELIHLVIAYLRPEAPTR